MEFGFSACVCSNRKQKSAMLNKCNVIGHSTLNPTSQFDAKIETGITHLTEEMKIQGTNALRMFLDFNSHRPLACVNLAQTLLAMDVANLQEETTDSLGHPSPL